MMDKFENILFWKARTESPVPPQGFETRLEAAIASARASAAARTDGRRPTRRTRPLWAALAAALAVCLISGTALAVSPALRDLLWGGFEPYAQVLEPTEKNTGVYDGVEARIVSALSDGYINRIHLEIRDLTGDRVRQAWREFQETGDRDFLRGIRFTVRAPEALHMAVISGGRAPEPIGFDEETGTMTLEAASTAPFPPDMERAAYVDILTGAFGTAPDTDPGAPLAPPAGSEPLGSYPREGWHLQAALTSIPVRSADVGAVAVAPKSWSAYRIDPEGEFMPVEPEDPNMYFHTVNISQLGVTLNRDGDPNEAGKYLETRAAPDELTVTFRDGASVALSDGLSSAFFAGDVRRGSESWLFPEPLDPESVVSVTLGGTVIELP